MSKASRAAVGQPTPELTLAPPQSWHKCSATLRGRKQQITVCQHELQGLLRWQKFNCLCWNQARKQGQLSCPLKKKVFWHITDAAAALGVAAENFCSKLRSHPLHRGFSLYRKAHPVTLLPKGSSKYSQCLSSLISSAKILSLWARMKVYLSRCSDATDDSHVSLCLFILKEERWLDTGLFSKLPNIC